MMKQFDLITIVSNLIKRKSITPDDGGCQEYIYSLLKKYGYHLTQLNDNGVTNSYIHIGSGEPSLVFVGHTDVVPPGSGWKSDPFTPKIEGDLIFGRGSADMKGSLAAMIVAMKEYGPPRSGSLGLLLTSDEEGKALNGVKTSIKKLLDKGFSFDLALVGEPTSTKSIVDTIKIGRRGSLSARVTIRGKQGHVAYPHASNSIHNAIRYLDKVTQYQFDDGDDIFDATSLQIVYINSGKSTLLNVIPEECVVNLNIRYSPKHNKNSLEKILKSFIEKEDDFIIEFSPPSHPYLTGGSNDKGEKGKRYIEMVKKGDRVDH